MQPDLQPSWSDFERAHLWHPYASMKQPHENIAVESAQGVYLQLYDGRRLIDGMASWWCAIHGYAVRELDDAIHLQVKKMAHVMFGGLTHAPAALLAQRLLAIAPSSLQKVFYADSGSVAVEVAIKMAAQYWRAQGEPQRQKMVTIRGGYHGDTFAAMSVCDPENGMHHWFSEMLMQQFFVDSPAMPGAKVAACLAQMDAVLRDHCDVIAGVILEPMVQGAGGMRIYDASFLLGVRALCDRYGLLLIIDEIATGFGRTGKMFACEHAGIAPDIMCVGKALTGGYMTLAAVLVSDAVCEGIHADGAGVLMHGPTFMANPLACAVALASLDLLLQTPWQQRVADIESQLMAALMPCKCLSAVADVRVFGAIGVIEMVDSMNMQEVQSLLIAQGVWLRPFGKLLYTMPPLVISRGELQQVVQAMCCVAERLSMDG